MTQIMASGEQCRRCALTDTGDLNVRNGVAKSLLRIVPATQQVQVGATTPPFVACGVFSDGSMQRLVCAPRRHRATAGEPVDNSQLTWSSGDVTKATVDANGVRHGCR